MTDEKEITFGQDVDNTDDRQYPKFKEAVVKKLGESNVDLPANVRLADCQPEPFNPIEELEKLPIALRLALDYLSIHDTLTVFYLNGFNTESVCICKVMGYELHGAMHRFIDAVCEYGPSLEWLEKAALQLPTASKEELVQYNYYLDAFFHEMKQYQA